ncbi:TPA: indole-3-glycerol phosphate synthase TrpC, partial [Legionella pneumophila]
MNSILERIAKHKLEEVAVAKKNKPLHVLSKQQPGEIRDFI